VDKSIGQLSLTDEDGELFWMATGSGGKVWVRVDLSYSDNIPRYYIALQRDEPAVVLRESFDLFSWGGDWMMGKITDAFRYLGSAVNPADYDGTEPALTTMSVGSTTATAAAPAGIDGTLAPLYVKNRDLAGWEVTNLYEHAGYPRLSTGSNYYGILKTPRFGSKLTGASQVKVEFDVCDFPDTGGFLFTIEGPGSITSGTYIDLVESGVAYGGSYADAAKTTVTGIPNATGTSIAILSEAGGIMPSWNNVSSSNDAPKFWTHIAINIAGATSETRVVWNTVGVPGITVAKPTSSHTRFCLNNILITNLSYSGIKETNPSESAPKIYPSVVNEGQKLNVALPEGTAIAAIRIFDATGRLVKPINQAAGELMAPAQKGIFFVQVQTPDATFAPQRILVK
jgi:hypothetical protein